MAEENMSVDAVAAALGQAAVGPESESSVSEPVENLRSAASASSAGIAGEQVAREAASAAWGKKGEDVIALDLTALSDVCDYFVIATGLNNRQVDALVDEVEEKVAERLGEHPLSIEGRDGRQWVLMDYGSVLVHVFTPEARDYYRLEKLWADAPRLDLGLD